MRKQRRQIKVHVVRELGVVREIRIQARRKDPNDPKLDDLIILNREGSNKIIDLTRNLDSIPVNGEKASRVDDDVLNRIIADQSELQRRLYKRDPKALQALVEAETSAAEIKGTEEPSRRR
ncbi:hypothetical protein [Corynebacterium hadale]|uniref:hypothetical protein n=1 Tax=Corynebacterium hadale TaxID=2026255 RepID=UPI0013FD9583|nr:hypothetical protein [Corynebacterium hadale]